MAPCCSACNAFSTLRDPETWLGGVILEGCEELTHDGRGGHHDPEFLAPPFAVGRRFGLIALPRVDAQVGHDRDVGGILLAGKQVSDDGLEGDLPLVVAHGHQISVVAEIEELPARTLSHLAFEERHEVVAVEMVFEGLLARLVAGEQLLLLLQIRIAAGSRDEGRHPVLGRHDVVDDGAGLDDAGPLGQHRHPKASFVHGAFFAAERMIAAIGPAEDFRAIVAGEHHDRIVGNAELVQLGEQFAHDPVQFGHRIGKQAEARLAVPLLGQVREGVAPCGVVPEEERLVGLHRAVHEVARTSHQIRLDVLHAHLGGGIHARMRRQRARVRDLLLADAAPARILRRIIRVAGNAADDVARSEPFAEFSVLRILRVVGFLQRVEVVEDAVEFVEAVNRRQICVSIPEMVLADLRRRVAERFEEIRDRRIGLLQALFRRR